MHSPRLFSQAFETMFFRELVLIFVRDLEHFHTLGHVYDSPLVDRLDWRIVAQQAMSRGHPSAVARGE